MISDDYFFDLAIPRRPPTALYSLSPLGLRTGYIESLSSYVLRLAHKHRISRNQLIKGYVQSGYKLSRADSHLFTCAGYCDRVQTARVDDAQVSWAEIFVELTGNQDIIYCSHLWLTDIIANTGLFAAVGRYCPICFDESISNESPMFEQQIWNLDAVTACPKHGVRLRERRCHAPIDHAIPTHKRFHAPGHCSQCGSIAYRCNKLPVEVASVGELDVSKQIFGLFAYAASGNNYHREDLAKGLLKIAKDGFSDQLAPLARLSSLPKSQIWRWVNDLKSRPSIQSLLQICGAAGCTLASLLRGNPQIGESALVVQPRIRQRTTVSLELARGLLQSAISEIEILTSLQSIADKVGARSAKSLRDYFPELCGELVAKNKLVAQREAVRKRETVDLECKHLIASLTRKGRSLTLRNAATVVGTRWSTRGARGRSFLRLRNDQVAICRD